VAGQDLRLEPAGEDPVLEEYWSLEAPEVPVTGSDGTFVFTGIPAGRWRVALWLSEGDDRIVESPEIRVEPGRTTDGIEVHLRAPRRVELRVRWDSGEPAAHLEAFVLAACEPPLVGAVVLGDEGAARLALPSGVSRLLILIGGTRPEVDCVRRYVSVDSLPDDGTLSLTVGSPDVGSLQARVAEAGGRPVPGAELVLRDRGGRVVSTDGEAAAAALGRRTGGFGRRSIAFLDRWLPFALSKSDSDGRAFRGSLPPGSYEVTVSAEGFEPATLRVDVEARRKTFRRVVLRRR
jgi:hypothetical protein